MRRVVLLAFLGLCLQATTSVAFPPVPAPITLDHGYRYLDGIDSRGCAIGVGPDRLFFACAEVYGWKLRGKRFGLEGQEVDLSFREHQTGASWMVAHAVSELDGLGWKAAAVKRFNDDTGLVVENIDPATGAPTHGPVEVISLGPSNLRNVRLAFDGTRHVLTWIGGTSGGGYSVWMARLLPDLTLPDPTPLELGTGSELGAVDVAARSGGGMIAWLDDEAQLWCQPLGADGLPQGDPSQLSEAANNEVPLVTICRHGDNWLIAWSSQYFEPVNLLRVDDSGSPLGPGIVQTSLTAGWGLASAYAGHQALIAGYSGGSGQVNGIRVSPEGDILDDPPLEIASPNYGDDIWEYYPTHLEAAWTGQMYVLMWLEGFAGYNPMYLYHFPMAQWVTTSGVIALSTPLRISEGSRPATVGVGFSDGVFQAVISDDHTRKYLHVMQANVDGQVLPSPSRFTPPNSSSAEYDGPHEVRPYGDDGLAVVYPYHWETLGSDVRQTATAVLHGNESPDFFITTRASYWGIEDGYDVTITPDGAEPFMIREDSVYSDSTWVIGGDAYLVDPHGSSAHRPAVILADSGYIMMWVESFATHNRIYYAIPSLRSPPRELIVGDALYETESSQDYPHLCAGPNQILCVFHMTCPEHEPYSRIYATRFSSDGTLLDSIPIPVSNQPTNLVKPRAIWDGFHYVITWLSPNEENRLYATRMDPHGDILDGDGVVLAEACETQGRLASDGEGHVAVAYSGNQLLVITAEELAAVQEPDAALSDILRLTGPYPNPTPGQIELLLHNHPTEILAARVLDVSGRVVDKLDETWSNGQMVLRWRGPDDRRSSGSGVYYLQVQTPYERVTRKFMVVR